MGKNKLEYFAKGQMVSLLSQLGLFHGLAGHAGMICGMFYKVDSMTAFKFISFITQSACRSIRVLLKNTSYA